MPVTDAPGTARALYEARRTRLPIPPLTDADPSLGMADGYTVQQELVTLLPARGDTVVGHKVGATSKAVQRLVGDVFRADLDRLGPVTIRVGGAA